MALVVYPKLDPGKEARAKAVKAILASDPELVVHYSNGYSIINRKTEKELWGFLITEERTLTAQIGYVDHRLEIELFEHGLLPKLQELFPTDGTIIYMGSKFTCSKQ